MSKIFILYSCLHKLVVLNLIDTEQLNGKCTEHLTKYYAILKERHLIPKLELKK